VYRAQNGVTRDFMGHLMRIVHWLCLAVLAAPLSLLAYGSAAAPPLQDRQALLADSLARHRFIAYVPRSFSIHDGQPQVATRAGIQEDLQRLHPHFNGLITYGLGHGQAEIAGLAVEAGFQALFLGVWDPTDTAELDTAIALAERYPRHVIGLVLGNEGLFWKRYGARDLETAAAHVRARAPQLALGSSEPFAVYLDSPDAAALLALDLLLPNIHPRFEPWFDPANTEQATTFVVEVLELLRERSGKPVLIKETGLPSAPAEQGFTEARQAAFWSRLAERIPPTPTHNLAWFEAFDSPWKPRELQDEFGRLEASEAHWGLFRHDGTPKPVVQTLIRPAAGADSR
jgi:exo-beta-1,3-glucanase (GH17 family)